MVFPDGNIYRKLMLQRENRNPPQHRATENEGNPGDGKKAETPPDVSNAPSANENTCIDRQKNRQPQKVKR
jgi:hypothetical protein